jgi:hypothetical protein
LYFSEDRWKSARVRARTTSMHPLPLYSEGCVSFAQGIFTALTVADNVTDREISGHFDRARQIDKPGRPTATLVH